MVIGGVQTHMEAGTVESVDSITLVTPVTNLLGWITKDLRLEIDFSLLT